MSLPTPLHNEYLIGGEVSVSDAKGLPILSVTCDGPWVLLKLAPGDYKILARLSDSPAKPRTATVKPPRTGQMRVVMQFPDAS